MKSYLYNSIWTHLEIMQLAKDEFGINAMTHLNKISDYFRVMGWTY